MKLIRSRRLLCLTLNTDESVFYFLIELVDYDTKCEYSTPRRRPIIAMVAGRDIYLIFSLNIYKIAGTAIGGI